MNTWIKATIALSLLSLVACSGIPVSTDYDSSNNFKSMKTFAWLPPGKNLLADPLVDNDLMNKRVKRSVVRQLSKQGYVIALENETPDFLISYHVKADDKLNVTSFRSRFGYYPCWRGCNHGRHAFGYGFGGSDISVRQYKQGTFMLDVINPENKELMWRGVAGKRLSAGTPEERDEYVDEIITGILMEFPPER